MKTFSLTFKIVYYSCATDLHRSFSMTFLIDRSVCSEHAWLQLVLGAKRQSYEQKNACLPI